jgi:hypothetical protein
VLSLELVRRDRIEQILLGPIRDKLLGPERVTSMAKEMQEYYRQRTEAIQTRAVETPQELKDSQPESSGYGVACAGATLI